MKLKILVIMAVLACPWTTKAQNNVSYTSPFGWCADAGKGKTENGIYKPTKCEKHLIKLNKEQAKFMVRVEALRRQFPGL